MGRREVKKWEGSNCADHSIARGVLIGMAVCVLPAVAIGAGAPELPDWAYNPEINQEFLTDDPPEDGTLYRVPDSAQAFTISEIGGRFSVPDWYPNEHPPMPDAVSRGREPDVRPCARCHLPHGRGHPESASLAGLPAEYIVQQLDDFASGARESLGTRSGAMTAIAAAMTDEEKYLTAEYFSKLPVTKWTTTIETDSVPETYVGGGSMRHAIPDGGMEPIGMRIIEIPEDSHLQELRDFHSPFIAYVPPGSIEKGKDLATTGANKTIACGICHGAELTGLGNVPGLAGLSPSYVMRQLMDIRHGSRQGPGAALMVGVVANLTEEDMLNLAAYVGSL